MNSHSPDPPLLNTLSPSLLTQFNTLSAGGRRLFKQVYLAVWHHLWPVSRFDAVALAYSLPGTLNSLDPRLSVIQWFVLSRLYVLTSAGSQTIDSRNIQFSAWDRQVIQVLMQHQFVVRTSFDPAHPHAVKPSHITKTYITLTPSGLSFFRVVVKEINKQACKDSYLASVGSK